MLLCCLVICLCRMALSCRKGRINIIIIKKNTYKKEKQLHFILQPSGRNKTSVHVCTRWNTTATTVTTSKLIFQTANDLLSLFIWFDFIFSKLHSDRKLHVNLNTHANIHTQTHIQHILTRGEFRVIWTLVWFRSRNQTRSSKHYGRDVHKRGEKNEIQRAKNEAGNQMFIVISW